MFLWPPGLTIDPAKPGAADVKGKARALKSMVDSGVPLDRLGVVAEVFVHILARCSYILPYLQLVILGCDTRID